MKLVLRFLMITLILVAFNVANAQTESGHTGIGIKVGGAYGDNAGSEEAWAPTLRIDYQMRIGGPIYTQFGLSYAPLKGGNYSTKTGIGDIRLLIAPLKMNRTSPYLYSGFGISKDLKIDGSEYVPLIPLGVGLQTSLGEQLSLQFNLGYNLALSDELTDNERSADDLNRFTNEEHDGYFEITVGFIYNISTKKQHVEEISPPPKEVIVDRSKIDTDGDGLDDESEVANYRTDPLKKGY
jgi:hypothetical protein